MSLIDYYVHCKYCKSIFIGVLQKKTIRRIPESLHRLGHKNARWHITVNQQKS